MAIPQGGGFNFNRGRGSGAGGISFAGGSIIDPSSANFRGPGFAPGLRTRNAPPPTPFSGVSTALADVAIPQAARLGQENFGSIEELLRSRTDPALSILRSGSEEAVRLSQLGQQEATQPLERFTDLAAFEEQQALLGTSGEAAQEAAISGIPVSAFDRELQERQQRGFLRQSNVAGDLGSGATILGGQRLAGTQQAQVIQNRLAELEPLVAASRGVRSTLAEIAEAARTRQAQLQFGLGTQEAGIRFGTTAPLIESRLQQAELSGLQGITRAQQTGQIGTQLASLAGTFAPQIQAAFSPTPPPPVNLNAPITPVNPGSIA